MSKLITVYDDNDSLNNVLSGLTLGVDEIFFVYHHEVPKTLFYNIEKVIERHKDIKTHFIKLFYDREEIQELLDKYQDLIVDVGGAKYLSLMLFELAKDTDHKIIYYDDEENVIKDYRTHTIEKSEIYRLSIEDILNLKGGTIAEQMHFAATDSDTIDAIEALVENNLNRYSQFVKYLSKINNILVSNKHNKISSTAYRLNEDQIKTIRTDKCYTRTKELFELEGNNIIRFKTEKLRQLVGVSGAFLENYVYHHLIRDSEYDEVMMSAVIDFSNGRQKYPVRCEVDLLVLKKNELLFVSCKSNKIDHNDIHEIYVHNAMFGNCLSKGVICLCEEANEKYPSMYLKAYESGVYVIDKSNIEEEDFPDVFKRIYNDTYVYDALK